MFKEKPNKKFKLENEKIICVQCKEKIEKDEALYFEEESYCEECFNEYIVTCEHCGNNLHTDDSIHDENNHFCTGCFEEYYLRCADCNCIIRRSNSSYSDNNDDYYCDECYDYLRDDEDDVFLHEYGYKPNPVFYGENSSRYFGVELEIDKGGKIISNAKEIIKNVNINDELIYIKTDGSLDDGMEIVTHPMSLKYHINEMPWLKLVNVALDLGYKSHKTNTCGLHIHVNRTSLDNDIESQDSCIGRILFIVEKFWQELLRFSRRTESQIQ